MADPRARFYFDFVDPLSYLLELELEAAEQTLAVRVERVPFELRPPPTPLTDIRDASWGGRWEEARRLAADLDLPLDPPRLVPWSRKAHELHIFASATHDMGAAVRHAIFDAYCARGRDIGRIDELVEIGRSVGLDHTETKAVLDVDRYEQDVVSARGAAEGIGVTIVPVIAVGGRLVEGFRNRADLSTLLGGP